MQQAVLTSAHSASKRLCQASLDIPKASQGLMESQFLRQSAAERAQCGPQPVVETLLSSRHVAATLRQLEVQEATVKAKSQVTSDGPPNRELCEHHCRHVLIKQSHWSRVRWRHTLITLQNSGLFAGVARAFIEGLETRCFARNLAASRTRKKGRLWPFVAAEAAVRGVRAAGLGSQKLLTSASATTQAEEFIESARRGRSTRKPTA